MAFDHASKVIAAAALSGASALAAGPAAASLADPGRGGLISGGYFQGLPLGPKSSAQAEPRETTGMAGENCYLVPARVMTASGEVTIKLTRYCE